MRAHGSVAGVLVLAFLSGCGSGDGQTGKEGAASTTGAGTGGSNAAPAGPHETCPLSAAEVGEVVGVAVQQDAGLCMFEPRPGTEPRVLYVRQVSFACSDAVVDDPSFAMKPYDGLGTRAYASPVGGDLLVCTNPPFEITVDITPSLDDVVADAEAASAAARASERAAAEELARLILTR